VLKVEVAVIAKLREKLSADKVLWIWAVAMTAGLAAFWILTRAGLPFMEGLKDRITDRTVVFAQWWEDELEDGVLEKLAADFEEQNPGIRIRLERKSRDEVKALIDKSAGTDEDAKSKKKKPDMYSLEGFWIDDLDDELVPLNTPENEDTGGRTVSVIAFINPLFYNTSLLKAAGFTRPPKDQAEFLSYTQAAANLGASGAVLAFDRANPESLNRNLLSWMLPALRIPSENASEPFQFTFKSLVETLSFLYQLKPYLSSDPFAITEEIRLDSFTNGQAAMMIGPVSDTVKIRKKLGDDFGITTIPAPSAYTGSPVFTLSLWYAGVSAESELQEEAKAFTAFLTQRAALLARGAFAVPGSGKRDPELAKTDSWYLKAYDMYDAGKMLEETGQARKLNVVMYEEVKRMFEGTQTPEETASAIQSRLEKEAR
jgi:ABC-type glycerol-3-phosphate transport system substrate-binding protein